MTGDIPKAVNGGTVSLLWPSELVEVLAKRQHRRLGDIVDWDHQRPPLSCGVGYRMSYLQS